jgi:hypothetical protein
MEIRYALTSAEVAVGARNDLSTQGRQNLIQGLPLAKGISVSYCSVLRMI